MMKDFPIPVVAYGPGSQTEDEELQFMPLPSAMTMFALPSLNVEADPAVVAAACQIVETLRTAMQATPLSSKQIPMIELSNKDLDVVRLLNQTMGEGEVSIAVRGSGQFRIQETVFASVWRVNEYAADARLIGDTLMACAIPPIVTRWAHEDVVSDFQLPEKSPGIMNALSVLSEIVDQSKKYKVGDETHVVNLTLLPMSPEDMDCVTSILVVGTVTILSRGYGNCRISSTKLANVWWVQYFNSMDTLILNTIEVGDVPEVAQASQEDYEDSIGRLGEWLMVMQEPEKMES